MDVIHKLLITVLQEWENTHSNLKNIKSINNEFENIGNSHIINFDKNSNKENKMFNKSFCGLYQYQSTTKSPEIDIHYMTEINFHFNQAFGSKLQSSIIHEIVQILNETHYISQVCKNI